MHIYIYIYMYIYIYIYIYIQQLRIPPPCRFAEQWLLQLLVGRSACLLLFVFLWVRIRRTVVTLVAGRSVCVSAFICLPLGQVFGTLFSDLGFRGAPWGHIKGTLVPFGPGCSWGHSHNRSSTLRKSPNLHVDRSADDIYRASRTNKAR